MPEKSPQNLGYLVLAVKYSVIMHWGNGLKVHHFKTYVETGKNHYRFQQYHSDE